MTEVKNQSNQSIEHNLNDVWTAVRRQGEAVAEVRQALSSVADSFQDLKQELRNIRDIATRPAQPVNWVAIASLCVAILIAGGSYTGSAIKPIKDSSDEAKAWITARSEALVEDYTLFGKVIEQSEQTNDNQINTASTLSEARERIARLEGQMEATRDEMFRHHNAVAK
jgi:hypothetical protein